MHIFVRTIGPINTWYLLLLSPVTTLVGKADRVYDAWYHLLTRLPTVRRKC